MRRIPRRGFFLMVAGFALAAAVIPLAAIMPGLAAATRQQAHNEAVGLLSASAREVVARLGRGVAEQWRDLDAMAAFALAEGHQGTFRLRLETMKALNARVAWMGVALPNGRVAAATGGLLEGADVSMRPWFAAGLEGAFSGDVHDAVLLQRYLEAPGSTEPFRLIDFAKPLRRPSDGAVVGVIGSHTEWAWVRELIRSTPRPAGSEALLLARDGTVLIGPAALEGQRLPLRATQAAIQRIGTTTEEAWPDGDGAWHVTVVLPTGQDGRLPGFGWSVVLRQPAALPLAMAQGLAARIYTPLLIASALLLIAGLFLARLLARPVQDLAGAAKAIAEGRLDRPVPQCRATREVAMLSAALARLDGARHAGTAALAGSNAA